MKLKKVDSPFRKAFYSQTSTKGLQFCIDYLSIPEIKGISIISDIPIDVYYLDIAEGQVKFSQSTLIHFLIDNRRYFTTLSFSKKGV